ncbi:glycosyltransferase [Cyanobacteria bacterium FACHB-63]|nr:glycosyltransferase [Cyanobacteria bacterium FACHB-63]
MTANLQKHSSQSQTLQPDRASHTAPDVAMFMRELHGGGAEKVLLNLARGFIDRGLSVDLVLAKATGHYLSQVPPEIRIVDLKAKWVPLSLPKLVRYLREVQPERLLAALHYPCEIALWAKRLAGVSTRIVVTEHNHLSIESKRIPQLSVRLTPLAARLFYPWADEIVAVSHGVAEDLSRITRLERDRIQVIYNPIITPELFTLAEEPVEHPWFRSGEPPLILAVGRLHPQKDFPTLIRAFAQVRRVRSARLVILGDGPERERLGELIESLDLTDDVALLGFAQNPYAYMAKAAVLVLSSAWEGLSNVLVEAMALGTPIVSTDCKSGPAEVLAQGSYGELTPVGDSDAIASAILKTLASPKRNIDPEWLNQFTLATCMQQYAEILSLPHPNQIL